MSNITKNISNNTDNIYETLNINEQYTVAGCNHNFNDSDPHNPTFIIM